MAKLTNELISAAIESFEAQRARIDAHIAELRREVGDIAPAPPRGAPARL